ncbi:helix-turn-helix domain-containing protein [Desulfitobacterium chlororespirans]|uniref:Transcriptional regulator, contains XRE-family HTH domain n=1 Tax=Desulfitobacterium chlororespirans DSM 11544 TaxID=1121395 RepID=A0A1M7T617_9FIRM|nr:helix-turn-helix transcriptional regulator [Desulfitobacterium chlororespirans]SHN66183.1 Transcriptional regulator, contains XRE-family HTH domain [Desulfitobacterium chlororespirans DSM 11544]
MTFSERLIYLRKRHALTQNELADLVQISRSALSLYEIGKREPDFVTLSRLSGYFGVTTDYLLGNSDIPNPISSNDKIKAAITDDPELANFWDELSEREDLQLMFKQVKDLSPQSIRKIVKVIKAIEDEESGE